MKRYLTEQEQQKLLQAAKGCNDPLAQRDYWWMRLMSNTGARVNEFALLTAEQAEAALFTGWLVVPASQRKRPPTRKAKDGEAPAKPKRATAVEYLVTHSVRECLQALLAMHREQTPPADLVDGPAPLVWGREGQRLSVRSYQARLAYWAQQAGLGLKVSPHWLRHTRAMNIIRRSRSNNPLKVVQQALGHATIASTGIYTAMSREDYARDLQLVDGARMSKAAARRLAQGARP